jgi:arylformamidase
MCLVDPTRAVSWTCGVCITSPLRSTPHWQQMAVAAWSVLVLSVAMAGNVVASAAEIVVQSNLPYVENPHARQVLDVYAPKDAQRRPVVFWIHGGGWQVGDKTSVQVKPQAFVELGCVFVATNYRLLPEVDMGTLTRDVAAALGWTHRNIAQYGGDPEQILVMGHSAGAQLAALLCIDDRYVKEQQMTLAPLKGCVPVDGDTYDIPAIITTAEIRQTVYGQPQAKFGHREKFGNDPQKHRDFSAVTHVAPDKGIPPFLVLYVAEHPDVNAQAQRLGRVLQGANVPAKLLGVPDTTHSRINADLGVPGDMATKTVFEFVRSVVTFPSN